VTLCRVCCAQVATGRITGRASDSTGAIGPGTAVKGVNLQTSVEISTTPTYEGLFTLLNLITGQYRIEVDMCGFKSYTQGPLLSTTAMTGQVIDSSVSKLSRFLPAIPW